MKKLMIFFLLLIPRLLLAQNNSPIIILDGIVLNTNTQQLDQLVKPDDIKEVNVLKGETAVNEYGEFLGKNGIVYITRKQSDANSVPKSVRLGFGDGKPLFLIKDKVYPYAELSQLDTGRIASINMIPYDLTYVKKFGPQALNGIVLVVLKE